MASAKFEFCFLGRDGNMVCRHHNGNWIVFPSKGGTEAVNVTTSPGKEEVEDEE